MSIVNITIGKDRALIGCDTACRRGPEQGGMRAEMTKMVAMHRMGVVLAYRGESHMFKLIFAQCFFVQESENFDDLVARMPEIVKAARGMRAEDFATDLTLELYVVGWSPSRQRMAGAAYTVNGKGVLTDSFVDTWFCASSPELPGDPSPKLETYEAMFEHAQKQTVYGNTEYVQYATGGRFFIADITPERMTVVNVGELIG